MRSRRPLVALGMSLVLIGAAWLLAYRITRPAQHRFSKTETVQQIGEHGISIPLASPERITPLPADLSNEGNVQIIPSQFKEITLEVRQGDVCTYSMNFTHNTRNIVRINVADKLNADSTVIVIGNATYLLGKEPRQIQSRTVFQLQDR